MSDNIDYDELDKAVNEAIQTRSKHRAPQKPVRRQGQYIDFVARKRPLSTSPKKKIAPHSTASSRPVVKRVMRPQAQRPKVAAESPSAVVRPLPTRQRQTIPAQPAKAKPAPKVVAPKPTPKPAPTPTPTPPAPAPAPNANNYSLGGRSPFMIDTKVDKRPLGTNIPETSARTVRSTRNTYSQKDPSATSSRKRKADKHVITESPKKHSGWLWALAVLLIIGAGAGLGYLAYILVFSN